MWKFHLFRRKTTSRSEGLQQSIHGHPVFLHEDDFRQIELVPDDNLATLMTESVRIERFEKNHFDGSGFTDIYVRNAELEIPLSQRQITPGDLEDVLAALGYERSPNVMTGYGQDFREKRQDCVAFGKDYCAVYYDFKDNVVQHIWFTNPRGMSRERLSRCLFDLGQQWNLVLQDWNQTVTVNLKDRDAIDRYLNT
jgi:hypothetical protein